eukprot:299651_1
MSELYTISILGETKKLLLHRKLTDLSVVSIKEIHCMLFDVVYTDNFDNYWISSNDIDGYSKIDSQIITFFYKNQITIKNIFSNVSGQCIFWLSNDNHLYVNRNRKHFCDTERLTNYMQLQDVIDIKSGCNYSIALCGNFGKMPLHSVTESLIITFWMRTYNITHIPDLINLIQIFSAPITTIFRTDTFDKWNRICIFDNQSIIKVESGGFHSLYLQSNGILWSCGSNNNGQLGLGNKLDSNIAQIILFFVERNIKIKDMKCGESHNLAIDFNGRIYSWGRNEECQCGHTKGYDYITVPTLIKSFEKYNIVDIKCGTYHSYVMTDKYKHFLFGNHDNNQFILLPNMTKYIPDPISINELFMKEINGKKITNVYLGNNNTFIITR